ncbi:hypothetical protein GC176_13080 [bacterium]|nr:hypothetical protein [bacterium]
MSIAVAITVNDGVVMATDSAQMSKDGAGRVNIHYQKRKLFPLHDSLPLGLATVGLNRIAGVSIGSLCFELKQLFTGKTDRDGESWKLDPHSYTVKDVIDRVKEYLFDGFYLPAFESLPEKSSLTVHVGGVSAGQKFPEFGEMEFLGQHVKGPNLVNGGTAGHVTLSGTTEACHRLVMGYSPAIGGLLEQSGLKSDEVRQFLDKAKAALFPHILDGAMPLAEAADVARFLVETEIRFSTLTPDPDVVGGEVQLAVISREYGFKWLSRHKGSFLD